MPEWESTFTYENAWELYNLLLVSCVILVDRLVHTT